MNIFTKIVDKDVAIANNEKGLDANGNKIEKE